MAWIFDEEVLAVVAAIVIVASVFAVVQAINAGRVAEPFSELGLLGPNKKIADYPREVVAGSQFQLYSYVGNHEGKTMFYKILVKAGNRTTLVNETTPLNVEPFMTVYTVLQHNSSIIIPLNITLYTPMENVRLVFEMWAYNETLDSFTYYGRWNQLWLNVTKPPVPVKVAPKTQNISSSIESRLVEAYISIRRAEDSGGNVTGMVSMLNNAVYYAGKGEYARVEELVNQIISLEPKISSAGQEFRRMQLYYTIALAAVVAGVGLASFLYLRHGIWLIWSNFYGSWKIIPLDIQSIGSGSFEKKVKELFKSKNSSIISVKDVISLGDRLEYERWSVAREVFRWVKGKLVRLEDPSPPKTFTGYLFSKHNLSFPTTLTILALTVATIYITPSTVTTYLRYVLGSLFVLFIPGYSLIEALYPREGDLTPLERLALSIGLSLALVPLVGLILNYTPWGIRLDPIVVSLSALTVSLTLTASYRKFTLLKLKVYANAG
ncbi:MAG: DUF1616 domain-containing protein [Nitrososphaeria archaeon]|nr:DUF1616 domain-containing protein [Nitrososphaeria archaeon]